MRSLALLGLLVSVVLVSACDSNVASNPNPLISIHSGSDYAWLIGTWKIDGKPSKDASVLFNSFTISDSPPDLVYETSVPIHYSISEFHSDEDAKASVSHLQCRYEVHSSTFGVGTTYQPSREPVIVNKVDHFVLIDDPKNDPDCASSIAWGNQVIKKVEFPTQLTATIHKIDDRTVVFGESPGGVRMVKE
jgi:hypothetical protein